MVKFNIENLLYSSARSSTMVKGQDILVTMNEIELKDGLMGIIEQSETVKYLTLEPSMQYSKA